MIKNIVLVVFFALVSTTAALAEPATASKICKSKEEAAKLLHHSTDRLVARRHGTPGKVTGGLGLFVVPDPDNQYLQVAPDGDSPAARAGVRMGDKVTRIDGKAIKDFPNDAAVRRALRGKPGSAVRLSISREKGNIVTHIDGKAVKDFPNNDAIRRAIAGSPGHAPVLTTYKDVDEVELYIVRKAMKSVNFENCWSVLGK